MSGTGTSSSRIPWQAVDAADRARARAELRARRDGLDPEWRAIASRSICAALSVLLADLSPTVIALYWPIGSEPDLRAAFDGWHARGWTLALPRVAGTARPLAFDRWRPGARMSPGPHGTRQVDPADPVMPDVVVAPCVGHDAHGWRLGYGGGYYDRSLAGLPHARSIGVAFDACAMSGLRPGPHDLPMQWIVTETRTIVPLPASA